MTDGSVLDREFVFEVDDESGNITSLLPETIEVNGKTYRLKTDETPKQETTGSRLVVEQVIDLNGLESLDEIPEKKEFEVGGKTMILEKELQTHEEGVRNVDVKETVEYNDYMSAPTVPNEKGITYFSELKGAEVTVPGHLVSIEQTTDLHWKNDLAMEMTYHGYAGSYQISINGKVITYNENSPKWDGWIDDVVAETNLNTKHYRISDAKWNGEAKDVAGGMWQRPAIITGSRLVGSWTATYVGDKEVKAYNAKVTYRGDATKLGAAPEDTKKLYTIKAVAKYSLVEAA